MLKNIISSLSYRLGIIIALCEREKIMSARKFRLGSLAALIEPTLIVLSLVILRSLFKITLDTYLNPIIWLTIGAVIFYMFRDVALKAMSGISSYNKVLVHRNITPLDCYLGRSIPYFQSYVVIFTIVLSSIWFYEGKVQFDDPSLAFIVLFLSFLLSLGVGFTTFILGSYYPITKYIIRFSVRRLLFWTSGIFTPLYILPPGIKKFFTINPIVHATELLRHSINTLYPVEEQFISLDYLIKCSIGSIVIASVLYSLNYTDLHYLSRFTSKTNLRG